LYFYAVLRPELGATQRRIRWGSWAVTPDVKCYGHQVNSSILFNAEFRNAWS